MLATTVSSAIIAPVSDHLAEGAERAEREGFDAFVVRMDTPGGLHVSMRSIVRTFLTAGIPVMVP